MTTEERIDKIVAILDEKKADEIEVFNLDKADYIANYVVIANSLNGKHTVSLFDTLKKELRDMNEEILASDVSDDWAIADLGDTIVHIMTPQYRQKYSLESFLSEIGQTQES